MYWVQSVVCVRGFLWRLGAAAYIPDESRSLSAGASLRLGQFGFKQAVHVLICTITYFTASARVRGLG